jgi:hypothetical protein
MMCYKFSFNEKEYELAENNCDYYVNDEEKPVVGIEREDILKLIREEKDV